jgi:DNA (cytosine-5)-methyltransferase 1
MEGRPYRAVSLFSGAGGMDVGFANAGVSVLLANDVDPDACATYRRNHPHEMLEGSVENFFAEFRRFKGIDFLFGGPPCQGFSVAGKMNPDDERSALIHTFMDVVDAVQPRAFVCENVKALAHLSRWQPVREALLKRVSKNYSTTIVVLNSQKFGVPQNRERMFLIGFNRDEVNVDRNTLDNAISAALCTLEVKPLSLREVIEALGRAGSARNMRTCPARITFAKAPVLRRSAFAGMLFNGAGRPLSADGHSSTLPASMGGNKTPIIDEAEVFDRQTNFVEKYHRHLLQGGKPYTGDAPRNLRRLTVDECLAIQSFPPDYDFAGPQSAIFRQIGNAVPCKLAEVVASTAVSILQRSWGRKEEIILAAAE